MTESELDKRITLQDLRMKFYADSVEEIKTMLSNVLSRIDYNRNDALDREDKLKLTLEAQFSAKTVEVEKRLMEKVTAVQNWAFGIFAATVSSAIGFYITHR